MTSFGLLLTIVASVYGILLFFDTLLKSCMNYPYIRFLRVSGIELKFLQIKWYTHSLNRLFSRLGTWRPGLLHLWFTAGSYVAALLVLPAMLFLVKTLISAIFKRSALNEDAVGLAGHSAVKSEDQGVVLQPVLPGVNLPIGELGYYFLTLCICSIIHEAGHAVAAVKEDVRVLGFGLFVMFILPAAFVDLPTDQLMALRPMGQLRVFAAGVWHNIVLTVFSYLLLFSVPFLSSPFYTYEQGISIFNVNPNSVVKGPTGLENGDVIHSVNECLVTDIPSWRLCLIQAIAEPTASFCMHQEMISSSDKSVILPSKTTKSPDGEEDLGAGAGGGSATSDSVVECCGSEGISSSLCFIDVKRKKNHAAEDIDPDERSGGWKGHACLGVRKALEQSVRLCNSTSAAPCPSQDYYCMQASLSNTTKLLRISRGRDKVDFLFVGQPAEVYHAVDVSAYAPKMNFLPIQIPSMIELLSHYVASFSGALAVLNVVPCFMLDGQHMIRVLVDLLFPCYDENIRSITTLTFTIVGTVLLALNIIVGLWTLL